MRYFYTSQSGNNSSTCGQTLTAGNSINIACGSNDVVKHGLMDNTLTIGLSLIFSIVLFGPFLNKTIEGNLEAFLFIMGVISLTLSRAWSPEVIHEGLVAPINITLAVLGAGVVFHYLRGFIDHMMRRVLITVPLPVVVCAGIVILGLISSVISAIIAALLLVEFITVLPLHRHAETNLTIIACFAMGLGAALTPLGEPLSTIVVSKLSGAPYHATFYYLFKLLGPYVIPATVVLGIGGMFLVHESVDDTGASLAAEPHEEKLIAVFPPRNQSLYFRDGIDLSRRRLQAPHRRLSDKGILASAVLAKYGIGRV
jgi:predicted cation transporter